MDRKEKYGKGRQRLLATAVELFHTDGIRATGVDTLVRRAGFTKPILYRHWPSKDELVADALRERDRATRVDVEAYLAAHPDVPAAERPLLVFDWRSEDLQRSDCRGCAFCNAVAELPEHGHPAHDVARAHKRWFRELFRRLATDAGARDPDRAAAALELLHEGAIAAAQIAGDPAPVRDARAAAARVLRD
jgi:AcrR family transcriptional regulator